MSDTTKHLDGKLPLLADLLRARSIDHAIAGVIERPATVDVELSGQREGLLDNFHRLPAGPKAFAITSRGGTRPPVIEEVFLFDAPDHNSARCADACGSARSSSSRCRWMSWSLGKAGRTAMARRATARKHPGS